MDAPKQERCLYEVLGLKVGSVDAEELKRAYRKAALQWHPDKHGDKNARELETVHQRFLEVQEAFRVLSDPQEKAWYDDHREDILRGAATEPGEGTAESSLPNLWPYFSSHCFSNYNAGDPKSFYEVYTAAFTLISAAEPSDAPAPPQFGNESTPWKKVVRFYQYWTTFVSQATFAWADKWRVPSGESRDIRREMKKENDRSRASAKKKWHETVRQLALHVKQRDKRVLVEQQRVREESERERVRRAQGEESKRMERQMQREEMQEQELDPEEEEYWENMRRKYGVGGIGDVETPGEGMFKMPEEEIVDNT
jgi:DnaJ family protein A protein 5